METVTVVIEPNRKQPRLSIGGAKIDIKNPSMHPVTVTITVAQTRRTDGDSER